MSNFMTVDDIARRLNVAKPTVYGWVHRGIAPPYMKFNGTIRFPEKDFVEWVNKNLIEPSQQAA